MHSATSTSLNFNELTTVSSEQDDFKRKNDKVFGVRCTKFQGMKDSSQSSKWADAKEYLSRGLESVGRWGMPLTDYWRAWTSEPFEGAAKDIIAAYMAENLIHMRDINSLFVREYAPFSSIDVLHSLVGIGEEVFSDARPRNEDESRRIDDFVRSKAKTIFTKPL